MFKRHLLPVAMAISLTATAALPAHAYLRSGIPTRGFIPQTSFMAERGRTSAPFAHIEFCVHSPSECVIRSRYTRSAQLNSKSWRMLKQVNYRVNRSMRSLSDRAARGKIDHWSVGGRVGDCEDYALTKRHELIRRGWSSSSVLVATVKDRRNRSHAVLIAHTNRGDFVLDNLTGKIRAWNKTGYRWLKRQSRQNPRKWVRLNGRPLYTASLPSKSGKQASKNSTANKASALAVLQKTRALKKQAALSKLKKSKSIWSTRLIVSPPLPTRNAARHSHARLEKLRAQLAQVQKRLMALKKSENRIARLLARLEKAEKPQSAQNLREAKESLEISYSRKAISRALRLGSASTVLATATRINVRKQQSSKKVVRSRTKARKIAQKRRAARTTSRKRPASRALALLKKIRRSQHHTSRRSHTRRWSHRNARRSPHRRG